MTKPTKWHVRPPKTQISLGICPVWSASSLLAWRKLGSLATHWAHSEDSDQTGWMPRLIWVFAKRTVILWVLSWGGSFLLKLPTATAPIICREGESASAIWPFGCHGNQSNWELCTKMICLKEDWLFKDHFCKSFAVYIAIATKVQKPLGQSFIGFVCP